MTGSMLPEGKKLRDALFHLEHRELHIVEEVYPVEEDQRLACVTRRSAEILLDLMGCPLNQFQPLYHCFQLLRLQ